jgi:hypothetical protein
VDTDDDGKDHVTQELLVLGLNASSVCKLGAVDARRPDANAAAQALADAAKRC